MSASTYGAPTTITCFRSAPDDSANPQAECGGTAYLDGIGTANGWYASYRCRTCSRWMRVPLSPTDNQHHKDPTMTTPIQPPETASVTPEEHAPVVGQTRRIKHGQTFQIIDDATKPHRMNYGFLCCYEDGSEEWADLGYVSKTSTYIEGPIERDAKNILARRIELAIALTQPLDPTVTMDSIAAGCFLRTAEVVLRPMLDRPGAMEPILSVKDMTALLTALERYLREAPRADAKPVNPSQPGDRIVKTSDNGGVISMSLDTTLLDRDQLAQDYLAMRGSKLDGPAYSFATAAYEFADEMIRTSYKIPDDVKAIQDAADKGGEGSSSALKAISDYQTIVGILAAVARGNESPHDVAVRLAWGSSCATEIATNPKYRPDPWGFLLESGLIFEINRTVLHPLGMAIALRTQPAEEWPCSFYGLQWMKDDPEGIIFGKEGLAEGNAKLAAYMVKEGTARHQARKAAIGSVVEGETDEVPCAKPNANDPAIQPKHLTTNKPIAFTTEQANLVDEIRSAGAARGWSTPSSEWEWAILDRGDTVVCVWDIIGHTESAVGKTLESALHYLLGAITTPAA